MSEYLAYCGTQACGETIARLVSEQREWARQSDSLGRDLAAALVRERALRFVVLDLLK